MLFSRVISIISIIIVAVLIAALGLREEYKIEDDLAKDVLIPNEVLEPPATTTIVDEIINIGKIVEESLEIPSVIPPESPKLKQIDLPKVTEKLVIPDLPDLPPKPITEESLTQDRVEATSTKDKEILPQTKTSPLPKLDRQFLLFAVVKIQCPTQDGLGKYIGSGFSIGNNIIITAAHVVMDSGSQTCDVIFPGKNRHPIHYLKGKLEDIEDIKKRHNEQGIDVAIIRMQDIKDYPEANYIFPEYPLIPYPLCLNPVMIGDKLLHYGYPSNFVDQDYLSEMDGEAVVYADIKGIEDQFSQDLSSSYKTPIFSYTSDQSKVYPYMVSRVPSFYGDSGGLAFNETKQCILGPHRGGTIGRGEGENYSIFPVLGGVDFASLIQ